MKRSSGGLRVVTVVALFIAEIAFAGAYAIAGEATQKQQASDGIKAVRPGEVCMVNDSFMGKPQIPVLFEGKTYFGCCEGCVERIKGDRSVRYSKDPLTGREVDKAKAFITTTPDETALYFESRRTAERYYALINAKKSKAGGAGGR